MDELRDKIWITSKTRINSEQRYRRYDISSHIFLSYMSFLMIVASVFSKDLEASVPHFDKINIVLPLALFAVSIIIYGFRFSERAGEFRHCYLKLQELQENLGKTANASEDYSHFKYDADDDNHCAKLPPPFTRIR